ncbi:MAG: hypothetical protein K0U98_11610 [Deltaproteobacteria bacterium]|nr:hypothetical protein [Deltaproteobacteria bacterium]
MLVKNEPASTPRRVGSAMLLAVLVLAVGCTGRQHGDLGQIQTSVTATSQTASQAAPQSERSALRAPGGCTPDHQQACQELYLEGSAAAMYPEPEDVRTDLVAILPSTPGLVWDGQGRILLSTWTRWEYYEDPDDPTKPMYSPDQAFPLYGDTWFTIVPQVQEACRKIFPFGMDWVDLRLEQLIGLPPFNGYDAFLQVWVDPTTLFRPCPDPEISDRECQTNVPVETGLPANSTPWAFCSDPSSPQVSSAFVDVASSSLEWMCDNWCTSYCNDTGYPCSCTTPEASAPFPWTALGYTYDWGRPANPQGFSEFVGPEGTSVNFESLVPTREYCAPPPR